MLNKKVMIPILMGLTVIAIYLFLPELQFIPFKLLKIDMNKLPLFIKLTYSIVYELIMLLMIMAVFRKRLATDFKDLKVNHKIYFDTYFKYWLLAISLMMLSNAIIMVFVKDIPANEELVRKIFTISPLYIYITAVIFAPIMEELVFRLGFRYIFKNDVIFILCSGLAFGGMHIVSSASNFGQLLYIIPYSIPGFIFAYALVKSKNIFVPMGLHFIHNGILVSIQLLILILK